MVAPSENQFLNGIHGRFLEQGTAVVLKDSHVCKRFPTGTLFDAGMVRCWRDTRSARRFRSRTQRTAPSTGG
jgi:hypothetical protein